MENKCLNCDYYNMKGKFYSTGNWSVYKHTAPSGKVYIGITSQKSNERWRNGKGYKEGTHFFNAISKYGWNNIKHEILFNNFTERMAKLMEQCLIVLYRSLDREFGYNMTLGGEGTLGWIPSEETKKKISEANSGKHHSKESREKMSEAHKGENNSMYGKYHSEESKKKMSKVKSGENNPFYGKHHSEGTREKMSEAHKGENNSMYGKHHSEESKKKISESNKGHRISKEHKKKISEAHNIEVMCLSTNKKFISIKNAAEFYGIKNTSDIGKCCRGIRKSCGKDPITGNPLRWAYFD